MDRRNWRWLGLVLMAALAACEGPRATQPTANTAGALQRLEDDNDSLANVVRMLAAARGIVPLPRPPFIRPALVRLGRALAFDRILAGTRDISCMTCHAARFATGDGKSLAVGQGGVGLGPTRFHPQGIFIPRNGPPLFNLFGMKHLFWDGRVEVDAQGRVLTPAGKQLSPQMTRVFEFGPISAFALFPVTSAAEMRGTGGNELATLADTDFVGIWKGIMKRLGAIPEYRRMFEAAYPGVPFDRMNFAHASNAIGGFIVSELTFADSPWDRFLAGRNDALTPAQLQGAQTFLSLKCSICHNGATFTDQQFHDVAVAQIGPGKGDGVGGTDDFGRFRVTGDPGDLYRFRTTPLRNVELTGPYGHDGAIVDLRAFVEHYSQSDQKLLAYDPNQLEPLLRGTLVPNAADVIAHRDTLILGVVLADSLVDRLMAYMSALTDPRARDLSYIVPARVPSGLPIDR